MADSLNESASLVLKIAEKRFTDVVVHASRSQSRLIKFANNELSTGRLAMDQSASLFVAKGKKVATANIKDFSKKEVEKTVSKLEKFIAKSRANDEYNGIAMEGFRKKDVMNLFDPRVESLSAEELASMVEEGVNAAISAGASRASGTLNVDVSTELLKSSGGADCAQKGTSISFSIRAFADKDASGHKVSCSRVMQHFRTGEAGSKAGELATQSLNPVQGSEGKFDVLFDPMAGAVIMQNIGDAASIFSVEAGFSFLEGKLNKKVGSDMLTVFDDGTLPGGMSSTNFDGEGVPAQKTTLIRFGVLRNYLHSTGTAKRYDVQTTGNAGILSPHPWNVVLDKGNFTPQEMIGELKNGIFITNLWYMRFQNYKTGEFSVIPRDAAFLVENGRITRPLKGLRISDSMANIMGGVEALSEKREQICGWEIDTPVKLGHMLVRGVRFTRSVEHSGKEEKAFI